jgi:lantibiotic protection ABC transporter MutG family permease subunit
MFKLFLSIKADFIKMKNTPFYWFHICVPIIGIVISLGWYSFAHKNDAVGTTGMYLQTISMFFPLLIGIICPMVIEQEAGAGRFKEMLGGFYGKQLSLISKILMLPFSGFISIVIAVGGFFIAFQFILHQNLLPATFYGYIILIIFGSQIFLYLFHVWLSFLWGPGASIGIGIFETLISALMHTGLGEGTWQWIPCGWGMRFSDYFFGKLYVLHQSLSKFPDFIQGVKNSIIFTIIFGIVLIIWFNYYEGRKEI